MVEQLETINSEEDREEKRFFHRFPARFPVKYKDTRDDYGERVFLRDASAEGVRILTRDRLFRHDAVSLQVELPDGFAPLTLNGHVVWVRPQGPQMWEVGIQFHQTHLFELHRLYRLVA